MAYSFPWSNTDASDNQVTLTDLGLTSNYAITEDTATTCELNNKTCALNTPEIVTFRSRSIPVVNHEGFDVTRPGPSKAGVQYQIQLGTVMTESISSMGTLVNTDEPIVAQLTIRHTKNAGFNNTRVADVVKRLISCLMDEDGNWRFEDLMRGAERPVKD